MPIQQESFLYVLTIKHYWLDKNKEWWLGYSINKGDKYMIVSINQGFSTPENKCINRTKLNITCP